MRELGVDAPTVTAGLAIAVDEQPVDAVAAFAGDEGAVHIQFRAGFAGERGRPEELAEVGGRAAGVFRRDADQNGEAMAGTM